MSYLWDFIEFTYSIPFTSYDWIVNDGCDIHKANNDMKAIIHGAVMFTSLFIMYAGVYLVFGCIV